MTIQLDNTTPVNYLNLREGNAFGFEFDIVVNNTPIDADEYNIELQILLNGQPKHRIADADWTKTANKIVKQYPAFPLPAGQYTFHLTYTTPDSRKITILPGTLKIITRDARRN